MGEPKDAAGCAVETSQPQAAPDRPDPPPRVLAGGGDDEAEAAKHRPDATPRDVFRALAKWAAEELKGKQQRVVVLLAQHDGRIEMKDLATDPVIDWDLPWWTKFNDMKKAINPKLHKHGWKVLRQGNVPRLTQIGTGQK